MTRHLFDGGELVIDSSTGETANNAPFTVWTDRVGGTDVTSDMRAPDGVTAATVTSDSDGEIPYLRGPDDMMVLFRDMGTDTRTPWYSSEAFADVLNNFGALQAAVALLEASGGTGVADHGALTGLGDNDHPQYLLVSAFNTALASRDAQIAALQTSVNSLSTALAGKAATTHVHAATDITSGLLPVARLTPGVALNFIWDDTSNAVKYNGATITGRPAARNDLYGRLVGGAETDFPAWLNQDGDSQDVTQT
jgi:hypothetical protein